MPQCAVVTSKFNSNVSTLRIPTTVLDMMVEAITNAIPTDSIYVFGSYARCEESASSDIDIMVVTKDDDERPVRYATKAAMAISKLMYDAGFDYDLLTRFRDDFLARQTLCTTVDYAVAREGVKIYG